MGFTLPRLTTEIDCAAFGYPGMVFTCWLNTTKSEAWESPAKPEAWDRPYYAGLGKILLRLTVPPELNGTDETQVIELGSAKAIYELDQTLGFDQMVLPWLLSEYQRCQKERLEIETKNS